MTIAAPPKPRGRVSARTAPATAPLPDRATAYAREVVETGMATSSAGTYRVGRFVRLACERHLRDLEQGAERGLRWDPAQSEWALDFFRFVHHFEGPKAGKPVTLEPWQCFSIGSLFGWQKYDQETQRWRRRFRKAFNEIAKKNGKSLTASGVGLLKAFYDGEAGAQAYAAATKRAQAKLVWGAARVMVQKSPALRARIKVRALSLFDPRSASYFQPLGKDTKKEDGINPFVVIVDEEHRHDDRTLIDLLANSMGARENPLFYIITTAGVTGVSVWAEDHDYAELVLEGVLEDDSLFAYIATLDRGDDPFDEANWPKANPNLGVSVRWDDMRERAAEARQKPAALNEFLRLRLDVRTQSVTRWMAPELWASTAMQPEPLTTERTAYGGLDLGARDDLAAFLLLAPAADGYVDVHARFFCPEDGIAERSRRDRVPYDAWASAGWITPTPGNVTDYDRIRAEINAAADGCYVAEVGYDPHDATQIGTQLTTDGHQMIRIIQSTTEYNEPVKEVERLVAEGKLRVGANPVLAWMVDNTVMVQDFAGRRKPDKTKARDKIDGVSALLMGLKRLIAHAGEEDLVVG